MGFPKGSCVFEKSAKFTICRFKRKKDKAKIVNLAK